MIRVPAFTVPDSVATLVSRLPPLPPTLALVAALNLALGRILPRDSLEPLRGRRLALVVTDAGLQLTVTLTDRGFRPAPGAQPADVRISACARDFLALALREEDPDTLFFNRRLRMEGDTDLGLLVKNTLDMVELPCLDPAALSPVRWIERLLFSR